MLDFLVLIQECAPQVAPLTMAAVIKTESGFNPLAIGINGGARLVRQPADKTEAVVTAKWLIDKGYNIDMGLGQINSANLPKIGLRIEDAFDPCKNVAAAATILHGDYQLAKGKVQGEQAALHAALSAYNTGSLSKGVTNGYVQKVMNNAGTVVPGITTNTVAPIALATDKPARRVVTQHAQASGQAVKLKAEREGDAAPHSTEASVYSTTNQSVMVY